jgi:hypothetical protein
MNRRFLASLGVMLLVLGLAISAAGQAQKANTAPKAAAPAKPWTVPRTADGQPDLQGYWTNNSYTPLQRANNVTKEFFTKQEWVDNNKRAAEREAAQTEPGTTADVHYDFTQFGLDRSQTRLAENLRTSVIVEPANGKLPPTTPEGQKRAADKAAERRAQGAQYDKVQNIVLGSRCIYSGGAPPMMPPGYNPAYQIVQSPGYVTILIEMEHETRVIPLDGRPHAPAAIRSWLGDSRGHWEGDTLVVETTNFNNQTAFQGSSENMKVTERFTRLSDDQIKYEFTVNDPSTWEIPWKGEMPFVKINGPVFEHACHEGNYGIANTLAAVRLEEKKAAEEAAKKNAK